MEFTPADYYYNDIRRCLQAEAYDIRRRCSMAYRLFVELVNETTADAPASFSGAFSRLHYLHAQLGFSSALYHAANDGDAPTRHRSTISPLACQPTSAPWPTWSPV